MTKQMAVALGADGEALWKQTTTMKQTVVTKQMAATEEREGEKEEE